MNEVLDIDLNLYIGVFHYEWVPWNCRTLAADFSLSKTSNGNGTLLDFFLLKLEIA